MNEFIVIDFNKGIRREVWPVLEQVHFGPHIKRANVIGPTARRLTTAMRALKTKIRGGMLLIVEDDFFYFGAIEEYLQILNIPYKHASNFKEAVALLEEFQFTRVITDFNFPGGNGDDVLRLARARGIKEVYLNSSMPGLAKNTLQYTDVLNKSDIRYFKEVLCPGTSSW